ncbi:hypothetical protein BD626DRAFT_466753 [Schizophyllum amplum]|uniref:Uncharacterized protein n=1 Tax=Schizophyllum amplum TaxID=97359 RepID=A0A550BUF2_9AGAR|nr:hypothetical protein BD626DRAFT_466753 [Auriculariopsis ampla]
MDDYHQTHICDHYALATNSTASRSICAPSISTSDSDMHSDEVVAHASSVLHHASLVLKRAALFANLDLYRRSFVPDFADQAAIAHMSRELSAQGRIPASNDDALVALDKDLSALRRQIWRQLALHRSLAAPVRRLPRELLSYIFVCFAGMYNPPDRIGLVKCTVARVCCRRTWYTPAVDSLQHAGTLAIDARHRSRPCELVRYAAVIHTPRCRYPYSTRRCRTSFWRSC